MSPGGGSFRSIPESQVMRDLASFGPDLFGQTMKFSAQALLDSAECVVVSAPAPRHQEREGEESGGTPQASHFESINVDHIVWRSRTSRQIAFEEENWSSVSDSIDRAVRETQFIIGKWTETKTTADGVVENESYALRNCHKALRRRRMNFVTDQISIPLGTFWKTSLSLNEDSVRQDLIEDLQGLASFCRALCPRFVVADLHILEISDCTFTPFFIAPPALPCSCSTVLSIMVHSGILTEHEVSRCNVEQTSGIFELCSASQEHCVVNPPCYSGDTVSVYMKSSYSNPVTCLKDGGFIVFDSKMHYLKISTGSLSGSVATLLLRVCECGNSTFLGAPTGTDELKHVWEENILRYREDSFLSNGVRGEGNQLCPSNTPRLIHKLSTDPVDVIHSTDVPVSPPRLNFESCKGALHKGQHFFTMGSGTPVFLLAEIRNHRNGDQWEEVVGIGRIMQSSYNQDDESYVRVHRQQFNFPYVLVQIDTLRSNVANLPFPAVFRDSTGKSVHFMKDIVPLNDEMYPWDADRLQIHLFSTTKISAEDKAFSASLARPIPTSPTSGPSPAPASRNTETEPTSPVNTRPQRRMKPTLRYTPAQFKRKSRTSRR